MLNVATFAILLSEYASGLSAFMISGLRVGFQLGHQGKHMPVTVPTFKKKRSWQARNHV